MGRWNTVEGINGSPNDLGVKKITFVSNSFLYGTRNRVSEYEIHSLVTDVGVKKTLSTAVY